MSVRSLITFSVLNRVDSIKKTIPSPKEMGVDIRGANNDALSDYIFHIVQRRQKKYPRSTHGPLSSYNRMNAFVHTYFLYIR